MSSWLLKSSLALLLAFGAAAGAAAQTQQDADGTWLPVWNQSSGKIEAYLVIEPAQASKAGVRHRFGNNSLDATIGLESGDSLALLCNRKSSLAGGLGSLPNNCLLASLGARLGNDSRDGSRHVSASAAFGNDAAKLGVTAGSGRDTLPAWLLPGTAGQPAANRQVDVNDLTVSVQKNLRNQGYVSIAGTIAKARLVPAAQAPQLNDRWSTRSLSVGGGIGNFGASIIGHVVDVPGQSSFSGLGLGLTWRTPWSGQLTVGADNVITRGKNPFSAGNDATADGEGTVPYVRYEQDL